MKLSSLLCAAVLSLALTTAEAQFVDLSTGKTVTLVKHQGNGMMYNTENSRPVNIYVNRATNDTFYGRTGQNINGRVSHSATEGYHYEGDGEYIYRDGEFRLRRESDIPGYKRKTRADGEQKVKYDDYKRKTEPNGGDVKIKEGDAKLKLEADGVVKLKDSTYKGKIDRQGNMLEKDDSTKGKVNADGTIKVKDKRDDYKGKVDEDGDIKEKDRNGKRKIKKDKVKEKGKTEQPTTL